MGSRAFGRAGAERAKNLGGHDGTTTTKIELTQRSAHAAEYYVKVRLGLVFCQ